jgi:hypothetical protein
MNNDGSAAAGLGILSVVYCLFVVAIYAFFIFLFWRIFTKTGQSGAMSLIGLIPGVGWLILLCILAFSTWPIQLGQGPRMMPGTTPPPATGYGQPGYGQPMPPYGQQPPQYPPYPPQ